MSQNKYLQHEKRSADHKRKVHRYEKPIILAKFVKIKAPGDKPYVKVYVLFQSTGSTNILMVNATNKVFLYVREAKRGVGDTKRCAIEINQGRRTHLLRYGVIYTIGADISKWFKNHQTVKWWHSSVNTGLKIAKIQSYYIYKKYASGSMRPEWKVKKSIILRTFKKKQDEKCLG